MNEKKTLYRVCRMIRTKVLNRILYKFQFKYVIFSLQKLNFFTQLICECDFLVFTLKFLGIKMFKCSNSPEEDLQFRPQGSL